MSYASQAQSAVRQIRRKGRPVVLIARVIVPPMDGTDEGIVEEIEYPDVYAIVMPMPAPRSGSGLADSAVGGGDVTVKGRILTFASAALPVPLDDTMLVRFDGKMWKVSGATPIAPGGVDLVSRCKAISA